MKKLLTIIIFSLVLTIFTGEAFASSNLTNNDQAPIPEENAQTDQTGAEHRMESGDDGPSGGVGRGC